MTPRELLLETIKPDGRPERLLKQYEAFEMLLGDPCNRYLRGNRVRGSVSVDRWGTTISFPADAPGPMPLSEGERKVLKDITHWREIVKIPDLPSAVADADWGPVIAQARAAEASGKLSTCFMGTGIFEQCHFLMGFADTLTNLYEHPEEMHALIEAITEYRIGYAKLLIEHIHPDVLFTHDDWGTKEALFMQPEMWREFFKEPYRRFYGYTRSQGVITVHHADSYLVPILDDMAEIGIQIWQGTLPENDIPAQQARMGGRLTFMGGIGAAIDRADASEEEISSYVREVLRRCGSGGHFIPSITYGLAGAVYPQVDPIIDREIERYNRELHIPKFPLAPEPERIRTQSTSPAAAAETAEHGDTLSRLSESLRKGKRKRCLALTQQALDEGLEPSVILSEGLVAGMNALGEDFSAGRAFVPEMLMAARCMNGATELLKPLLSSAKAASIGKVCLGTVRGDMHDIGKNLVKIMFEGVGLEVIDLGVDVPAEEFISVAQEQHCDLISCSALLTTTMEEMRRVVQLAEEAGIRDLVKIMVGGAPITQEFADAIGADAYTDDAAQAARVAVELLRAASK